MFGSASKVSNIPIAQDKNAPMYGTKAKGVRYLEMAEGYVTGLALDENDEVIGYQFVSLGKMTDFIKNGDDPNTAWEKAKGQYGRVADAVKIIDPRKE